MELLPQGVILERNVNCDVSAFTFLESSALRKGEIYPISLALWYTVFRQTTVHLFSYEIWCQVGICASAYYFKAYYWARAFTFDTWLKGCFDGMQIAHFLTCFHALKFHVMKLANPWHSKSSNDLNVNTSVEGFSSLRKLLLRWQKYGSPKGLIWSRYPTHEKLAYELPQFCWLVGSGSLRTLKLHHPGYLAPPKGPAADK